MCCEVVDQRYWSRPSQLWHTLTVVDQCLPHFQADQELEGGPAVVEALILAVGFKLTGAFKIQKRLSKRRAVVTSSSIFDIGYNLVNGLFIGIVGQ